MKNHQEIVYESQIGSELIPTLKSLEYSSTIFLVDSNTKKHCWPLLKKELDYTDINYDLIELKAGEVSKSIENAIDVWARMSELNIGRDAVLVNLGGGVVTDFGGFIASIYKRGISFIHYPTSLLAMVDASIGGKCGIDFQNYKNQLGVFQFPEKTIVNPSFLSTLEQEELLSAYAEMIKHALITDKTYWKELCAKEISKIENWDRLIKESVSIKLYLVEKDPLEEGERKLLNFGHTIGHSVEKLMLEKASPVSHGIAVAAGILVESYLSWKIYHLSESEYKEIEAYILKNYPKIKLKKEEVPQLIASIAQDKKNENNANRFTLLNTIGKGTINHNLQEKSIVEALEYYIDFN